MMQFNIGDKVAFDPPGRGKQIGTLVRFNKKSVTVITQTGQKWTVAPEFIYQVDDRPNDVKDVVNATARIKSK